MRLPLRRQILLPMVGVLLATVAVVSALNAWLVWARERQQLQQQLADVSQTLARSNFPLESNVLRQMRGLTGADYVVVDDSGQALAASDESFVVMAESSAAATPPADFSHRVTVGDRRYFHVALRLRRQMVRPGPLLLHVFYSEAEWQQARWQAIWPPLAIGMVSVAIVALVISLVAQRVTRPIRDLHSQVERIAQGDFRQMPVPPRDDEVKNLVIAVNQLTQRLVQYEEQIRQSERLRTLGTLGGGIAHQIRNAATGCRIAIDLHQRDCQLAAAGNPHESLGVAVRQLVQIENYIQRFLCLGRSSDAARTVTNLVEVVHEALDLVRPLATHRGITLQTSLPDEPAVLLADGQSLVQMIVNLVVNAVEAAAQAQLAPDASGDSGAVVEIALSHLPAGQFELAVGNFGPGPAEAIQPRLFQPFATDKPGGTGLGLAVARQIAQDHGGSVRWERRGGKTWFLVVLPVSEQGAM